MDTTPSHEQVFDKIWLEENKLGAYKMVVPDLNIDTYDYYKSVYDVNQEDVIKTTARKQKYIDMGISMNLHLKPEEVSGKKIYDLLILAWREGIKSTYYLRSKSKKKDKEIAVSNTMKEIKCFGCAG